MKIEVKSYRKLACKKGDILDMDLNGLLDQDYINTIPPKAIKIVMALRYKVISIKKNGDVYTYGFKKI